METIAAIDIGSNAIRLVLGELDEHRDIKVIKKVREAVRLGRDVFSEGTISPKTMEMALLAFARFRQIMRQHDVHFAKAVATSALREAKNREAFVREVKAASGIEIDVIDGIEEARLIHSAVAHRVNLRDKTAVLIDIGGGSVELTLTDEGRVIGAETFKLGTVRLLGMLDERGLKEKHLREMVQEFLPPVRKFLQDVSREHPVDVCIGTGGNFECLGKLRVALLHKNSIFSMTYHELSQLIEHLQSMTIRERIQFLRLRPDRADVVVPAAMLSQAVMAILECEMLLIPYVGLREGILADLGAKVPLAPAP